MQKVKYNKFEAYILEEPSETRVFKLKHATDAASAAIALFTESLLLGKTLVINQLRGKMLRAFITVSREEVAKCLLRRVNGWDTSIVDGNYHVDIISGKKPFSQDLTLTIRL